MVEAFQIPAHTSINLIINYLRCLTPRFYHFRHIRRVSYVTIGFVNSPLDSRQAIHQVDFTRLPISAPRLSHLTKKCANS